MNPLTYIKNMTSEDVQRIVRTGLTLLAGSLVTHGAISATATWVEPAIGVGVFVASFGWQLYGNRINAKLSEIAKMDGNPAMDKAATAAAAAVVSNVAIAAAPKVTQ
jgi:hypothetical protein